jgi:hypothetical protein
MEAFYSIHDAERMAEGVYQQIKMVITECFILLLDIMKYGLRLLNSFKFLIHQVLIKKQTSSLKIWIEYRI